MSVETKTQAAKMEQVKQMMAMLAQMDPRNKETKEEAGARMEKMDEKMDTRNKEMDTRMERMGARMEKMDEQTNKKMT